VVQGTRESLRGWATSRRGALALMGAVVLVAANLRPALASVSPVLGPIARQLHLGPPAVTALTTDPVLCFGLLAPLAPVLARRLGMGGAVAVAMAALVGGLALRLGPSPLTLYAGTTLAGGAIAVANVLLPAVVKRSFPARSGLVTGLYTTALNGTAALAAGLTVPVAAAIGWGWRGGLGLWCLPAAAGLVAWLAWGRRGSGAGPEGRGAGPEASLPVLPGGDEAAPTQSLLGSRLAWQVACFMGLQSLSYYAVLAWLPTLYQDHGVGAAESGALLAVATLVGTAVALVVPSAATARGDQRAFIVGVVVFTAGGYAGLLAAPLAAPYLWAVLLGIGQGAAFPLALTLLVVRTRRPADTARLSTMAQTAGYVIAAFGPLAVGAIHTATGAWAPAIGFLLVLLVPELVAGLGAGRPRLL
jgi:CP family cyanate transporter-like MFS transporter